MRQRNPPRKCDFCDRTFSRTEHLVRHRRTHTNEKPFSCYLCEATFPRADVQQKHMRRVHSGESYSEDWNEPTVVAAPKKTRSKVACGTCRRRKLRCSGESPCSQCQELNQLCIFSRQSRTKSISYRRDEVSERPGQPALEVTSHSMEIAVDDTVSPGPEGSPGRATSGAENQWSTANPQLLTPDLTQIVQPGNVRSWSHGQETANPELNQFRTPADLLPSHDDLVLGDSESFQSGDYGPADIGRADSLGHLDGFDTDFWPDGMDFSFADDLYGVAGSIGSVPGYSLDQTPRPELQLTLSGHHSTQYVMEMMQNYFEQISRPSSPRHDMPKPRWFSAPPSFQIYDEEVMNVFVNIAKHHLIKTFPIFAHFTAAENPRKELHLAYAAVGGLFCNIPGRFKVVNSMYNDARRMLLDPTYQEGAVSLKDRLGAVKTFILLEVYGLCSGDKRSYEFIEAFHLRMLSTVGEYKKALAMQEIPPEESDNETRALSESLYILECYRVILLLRPPGSSFRSDFCIRSHGSPAPSESKVNKLVTTIFTPGSCAKTFYPPQDNVIALATIALMAWPVFPKGTILPQKRTLWNPEFIELALNAWGTIQIGSVNWSTLLLYHLIHINIHTNMSLVQRFAHSPAESPFRARSGNAFAWIKQWQKSRNYAVAKWHAQSILRRVKDAMAASQKRSSDTLGDIPSGTEGPVILPEAPHLTYCVYFSALVLWCGSLVSSDEKTSNISSLETCSQLLGGMKVRVAELLEGILRELKI